jgi:hypothetical protein
MLHFDLMMLAIHEMKLVVDLGPAQAARAFFIVTRLRMGLKKSKPAQS